MVKAALSVVVVFAGLILAASGISLQHPSPGNLDPEAMKNLTPRKEHQEVGYIKIDGTKDGHLFYWLFEARDVDPKTAPLVMWLNGGPGCSSLLGLFTELGPYTIEPDTFKLVENPYSWTSKANVIFLDQPIGTGFSYGKNSDLVRTGAQLGEHAASFMEAFLAKFPQYKTPAGFYITGESYAGHYIPAITHAILARGNKVNLKGIALGNAWVHPYAQYPAYAEFGHENDMIGDTAYAVAKKAAKGCQKLIEKGMGPVAMTTCSLYMQAILRAAGDVNPYDIRIPCEVPPLCYDMSQVEGFLNLPETKAACGVPDGVTWRECDMVVHTVLTGDWMVNYDFAVVEALAAGLRVLVYSGDTDFIVNWMGGQDWSLEMEWPGHDAFNAAKVTDWEVNSTPAGKVRTAEGLTFLQVFEAGHMVPMDQPVASLDLINRFLDDQPF